MVVTKPGAENGTVIDKKKEQKPHKNQMVQSQMRLQLFAHGSRLVGHHFYRPSSSGFPDMASALHNNPVGRGLMFGSAFCNQIFE